MAFVSRTLSVKVFCSESSVRLGYHFGVYELGRGKGMHHTALVTRVQLNTSPSKTDDILGRDPWAKGCFFLRQ